MREVDTVARFGGDEFMVMPAELDTDKDQSISQARSIAEKIRAELATPHRLTLHKKGVADITVEHRGSASLGVAMFLGQEAKPSDLQKWADAAMYRSKDAGRDVVLFHGG